MLSRYEKNGALKAIFVIFIGFFCGVYTASVYAQPKAGSSITNIASGDFYDELGNLQVINSNAVILTVHLSFLLLAGKLFKLDLAEIVIASNANMGGPTTAAAMAVARKWKALVIPAILCGTLGYAVATFIGVAVGYWLR